MPVAGALRAQVLNGGHVKPLGRQFGRDKTLALARRSVRWPGLPAAVDECARTSVSASTPTTYHRLACSPPPPIPT